MKWIPEIVVRRCIPDEAAAELDRIEEYMASAHKLIKEIANHTWDDEHRLACQSWLSQHPEPEEEQCSQP